MSLQRDPIGRHWGPQVDRWGAQGDPRDTKRGLSTLRMSHPRETPTPGLPSPFPNLVHPSPPPNDSPLPPPLLYPYLYISYMGGGTGGREGRGGAGREMGDGPRDAGTGEACRSGSGRRPPPSMSAAMDSAPMLDCLMLMRSNGDQVEIKWSSNRSEMDTKRRHA